MRELTSEEKNIPADSIVSTMHHLGFETAKY